jgi:DNA-binding response OmpR family regulator
VARWLKKALDIGVLILTAADSSLDRVAGLESGADD